MLYMKGIMYDRYVHIYILDIYVCWLCIFSLDNMCFFLFHLLSPSWYWTPGYYLGVIEDCAL